jgi:hypothetical protein
MAPAALVKGVGRAMEATLTTSAAVPVDFVGQQTIIALLDGKWPAINLRIEANRLHSSKGVWTLQLESGRSTLHLFSLGAGLSEMGRNGKLRTGGTPTTSRNLRGGRHVDTMSFCFLKYLGTYLPIFDSSLLHGSSRSFRGLVPVEQTRRGIELYPLLSIWSHCLSQALLTT